VPGHLTGRAPALVRRSRAASRALVSLAVAGAAFAVLAFGRPPERASATSRRADVRVPQPVEELTVTVSADHDMVPARGTLRITVTVRNAGKTARTLGFTSGCATDYELVDAGGQVAASSDQMCAQAITSRTLAAGGSFSDVHVHVRGLAGVPVLAAGTYTLRAVLLLATGPVRSAGTPVTFQ